MKSNQQDQEPYNKRENAVKSQDKQKRTGLIIVIAALLLIVGIGIIWHINQPAFNLIKRSVTIELGSELVFSKTDYVEADPDILYLIDVDTSSVNMSVVGEYPIIVTYKDDQDTITAEVVDTTPPVAKLVTGEVTIEIGETIVVTDLVRQVEDFSSVMIGFSSNGEEQLTFSETGDQTIEIFLTDSAGNRQTYLVSMHVLPVDTIAPVISGINDMTITLGQSPDLYDGIEAWDDRDGNLTDQITCTDDIDVYHEGVYSITYSIKDRAQNLAVDTRSVSVIDPFGYLRETNNIIVSDDPAAYAVLTPVLDYLGERIDKMGIVYHDLKTGKGFTINSDKQFRSASTAKLFVNMAMYDLVEKGQLSLSQKVYYTPLEYEGGTGILQNMDKTGGFTLETLADYSILYSDNIAFNMILHFIGRENALDYYESVINHDTNRQIMSMGALDGYELMELLYKSNSENLKHMLDMMKETSFSSMLPKYLATAVVAHKVGFYSTFYHDVGIVYDQENPYIIAVFTDGLASPEETIAEVSRLVYENH